MPKKLKVIYLLQNGTVSNRHMEKFGAERTNYRKQLKCVLFTEREKESRKNYQCESMRVHAILCLYLCESDWNDREYRRPSG